MPANLFVAGFIGSPPMNLISGKFRGGDKATFVSPDFSLELPGTSRRVVDGQEVVLGSRPQDIALVPGDTASTTARGKVWVVELIGSEKLVEVTLGDRRRITVQVRAETNVNIDDTVGMQLDTRRVHLFDATTGDTL